MKKQKTPKPRNPYIQHLVTKKQGAHVKSKKAIRRKEKVKMQKDYFNKVAA